MLKTLRKKFILTAMAAVVIVLVLLVSSMNVANFADLNRTADGILQVLYDNNGRFPSKDEYGDIFRFMEDFMPAPGWTPRNRVSEETPFETRYFTVAVNSEGTFAAVDTGQIAAVDTSDAVDMTVALLKSGRTGGYSGNYKFVVREYTDYTLFIFLDCTRDLNSAKSFLAISITVAVCGALVVLLLIWFISGRILKPITESYEKQKIFITNAGHEIKTPIAVINSCTDVLELEQGENRWTKGIREQVDRLSLMTRNLVDLARMDETAGQITRKEFDISALADEIAGPYRLVAERKELEFELTAPETLTYTGDESLIGRLFTILLDNAIKYTSPNGRISFSLEPKGKKLVISTHNPTTGITQGSHNELFDRFRRGDDSHSSEISGYGIGLSMAKAIAEAHGGKAEACSTDGSSLTVSITI